MRVAGGRAPGPLRALPKIVVPAIRLPGETTRTGDPPARMNWPESDREPSRIGA